MYPTGGQFSGAQVARWGACLLLVPISWESHREAPPTLPACSAFGIVVFGTMGVVTSGIVNHLGFSLGKKYAEDFPRNLKSGASELL